MKYTRVLFWSIPLIIFDYFKWMLKYSRHKEKYSLEERFGAVQKIIQKVIAHFHIEYDLVDCDEFFGAPKDSPNRFIACNHISDIDPLILIAKAKRPISVVAKIETSKYPFVGRCIKILDGEFIDRNDLMSQARVFKRVGEKMKTIPNLDWIIFVEGKRNKEDVEKALEFHPGSFRQPMKANLDICCFSIWGTHRILNIKDQSKYYPVHLKLNAVIKPEEYKNLSTVEVANYAHEKVQQGIDETKIINTDRFNEMNKKKKKIENQK